MRAFATIGSSSSTPTAANAGVESEEWGAGLAVCAARHTAQDAASARLG